MRITGIIWLDSVVEKIDAKHGVSREEVCQVLHSTVVEFRFVEKGHRRGENVYAALSQAGIWSCSSSISQTIAY